MIRADKNIEKKWFVFYTKSRHEKSAFNQLQKFGYKAYLPMQKIIRQWSDRKKTVEIPLISSYIFVKVAKHQLLDVLNIPGISRYISFNGIPATVREQDLEILQKAIENKNEIKLIDAKFENGTLVKFVSGVFSGYSGKIIKQNRKNKLAIEIDGLSQTILVTVDKCQLKAS